MKLCCSNRD